MFSNERISLRGIKTNSNIFLTGATGLLGYQILRLLIYEGDSNIFLLIRAKSQGESEKRGEYLLRKLSGNDFSQIKKRINIICGDITKQNLNLMESRYDSLCKSISEIFHCAALTNLQVPPEKVILCNLEGTRNLLEFAEKCKNFRKFNYVSSAFIAGNHVGNFSELDLALGQGFNNPYERSKYEVELLIKEYINKGNIIIPVYRPSIITSGYDNDIVSNAGLLYQLFKLLSLEIFTDLPVDSHTLFNLIPSDVAAKAIYILSSNYKDNEIYHITTPDNISIARIIQLAAKFLNCREPNFVDIKKFHLDQLSIVKKKIIEPLIPYLNFRSVFRGYKTEQKLKLVNFAYPRIDDNFLLNLLKEYRKDKHKLKIAREGK